MVRRPLRSNRRRGRLSFSLILGAAIALVACAAGAQTSAPDTIARVKPSIVAVGTFERLRSPQFAFHGTGFAVGDGRLVATNNHVVPKIVESGEGEFLVVAVPGGANSAQIRRARKVAAAPEADLVLLSIEGAPLPALPLGDATHVREGESVLFTGFPIGSVLGLTPVTHRAMVSAITPIVIPAPRADQLDARTVRRLQMGSFSVYQLDGTAYPGNSGSPVYSADRGEVIGIVNSVFVKGTKESVLTQPSGITYAIPAQRLKELLETTR